MYSASSAEISQAVRPWTRGTGSVSVGASVEETGPPAIRLASAARNVRSKAVQEIHLRTTDGRSAPLVRPVSAHRARLRSDRGALVNCFVVRPTRHETRCDSAPLACSPIRSDRSGARDHKYIPDGRQMPLLLGAGCPVAAAKYGVDSDGRRAGPHRGYRGAQQGKGRLGRGLQGPTTGASEQGKDIPMEDDDEDEEEMVDVDFQTDLFLELLWMSSRGDLLIILISVGNNCRYVWEVIYPRAWRKGSATMT